MQPYQESFKNQPEQLNQKVQVLKKFSQNINQISYIQNSDVTYIAATQNPVWPTQQESQQDKYLLKSNRKQKQYDPDSPAKYDQRKMVINCGGHPYNALGKIIALFCDPVTKKPLYHQEGTAFLISQYHIMTTAHTLYSNADKKKPKKGVVKADQIQFFLEPLFLKKPIVEQGKVKHEEELLANGIKAHVVLMDEQYQKQSYEKIRPDDWVMLELDLEKEDIRTQVNNKPLECNFIFDFGKNKEILINIAGYPRKNQDFQIESETIFSDEEKSQNKKSKKIVRQNKDIHALYFQQMQAIGLSECKKFIFYAHSVSPGTCGAPLLLFNPQIQRHQSIGIHIGQNSKTEYSIGLLFSTICNKNKIQQLIRNNRHQSLELKQLKPIRLDDQQITNKIAQNQRMPQFLILKNSNSKHKPVKTVANNGILFPYLIQINDYQLTQQQLIAFANSAHKYPHLQTLSIAYTDLSNQIFYQLAKQSLRFTNLRSIYFTYNEIKGEVLKVLFENCYVFPNLQQIFLFNNQITDQAFKALFQNSHKFPTLQQIDFNINKITGKGLKDLVDNGHTFSYLHKIDLSNNQIILLKQACLTPQQSNEASKSLNRDPT